MAIEASNLTEKDELITKFYTVRAGLSVIAEQSSKIRLAESNLEKARENDENHDSNMEWQYMNDCKKYNVRLQDLEKRVFSAKEAVNEKNMLFSKKKDEKKKIEDTPAKKYYNDEYSKLFIAVIIIAGILTFGISFMGVGWLCFDVLWMKFDININSWIEYLLQWVIGISSTVGVCYFIYTTVAKKFGGKNKQNKIFEINREIENAEKALQNAEQELVSTKAEYDNYFLLRPKRENYSFYKYRDDVVEAERNAENVISSATATAKSVKESLTEYTEGLLIEDDWKNVDLLIFYLKTGRANSLQDALLLVDTQRRTDQITEAIAVAAQYVGSSLEKVSVRIDSLSANMTKELNRLGSTIERNNSYLISAVSGTSAILGSQINRFNEEMSRQNQALLKAQDVNNALLERANTQSDELMEELRYNQKYWVK